jgi:hypothetical protein
MGGGSAVTWTVGIGGIKNLVSGVTGEGLRSHSFGGGFPERYQKKCRFL